MEDQVKMIAGVLGRAIYSDDMVYRYLLSRGAQAGDLMLVTFLMLNPSTASHDEDDPTIRRCRGFARREYAAASLADSLAVEVVNLFAFRATLKKDCFAAPKPVGGEENDDAIIGSCQRAKATGGIVIAAWGNEPRAARREREVLGFLAARGFELWRFAPAEKLARKDFDYPPHPLYLKSDTPIVRWR
jgi:hypothetical protein